MSVEGRPGTPGALQDLVVVELGDGTSAPYAAKLFGDLGAEVIKVEPPEGDSARRRGPFPDGRPDPEASGLFMYLNINKRGVTIDIETVDGRVALGRLLENADVFVTNLPAGRLDVAGLSPATLRAKYPRLIVTTISPFGSDGPWANRLGDELVTYAMGGIAYSTPGMPDAADDLYGEPPLHPSCFVAETIAGVVSANGTMSAVLGREMTGEGCHVEVSQQAAMAAMQIRDVTTKSYTDAAYVRVLSPITIGRMPNFYLPCKDGYVTVAAPMIVHWERLVELMGSPDWAKSELYATEPARTANWVSLRLNLIDFTMTKTGDEMHQLGEKYQLPLFPFYSIRKMMESAHSKARGTIAEVEIGGRKAGIPAAPFQMRATPWALRRPAPRLGEHNGLLQASEKVPA